MHKGTIKGKKNNCLQKSEKFKTVPEGRMDGQTEGGMDGQMGGWTDGRNNGWTVQWMVGPTDQQTK